MRYLLIENYEMDFPGTLNTQNTVFAGEDSLVFHLFTHLKAMEPGLPKDKNKLKMCLKKWERLVEVYDPLELLSSIDSKQNSLVAVESKCTININVNVLEKQLCRILERHSQSVNGNIVVLRSPDSSMFILDSLGEPPLASFAENILKGVKKEMASIIPCEWTKVPSPKEIQQVIDQTVQKLLLHVNGGRKHPSELLKSASDSIVDHAIHNLEKCGYIKLQSTSDCNENEKTIVYSLPSPFFMKMLRSVQKNVQLHNAESISKGRLPEALFTNKLLINNSRLQEMERGIKKMNEDYWQQELSEAFDVLNKAKNAKSKNEAEYYQSFSKKEKSKSCIFNHVFVEKNAVLNPDLVDRAVINCDDDDCSTSDSDDSIRITSRDQLQSPNTEAYSTIYSDSFLTGDFSSLCSDGKSRSRSTSRCRRRNRSFSRSRSRSRSRSQGRNTRRRRSYSSSSRNRSYPTRSRSLSSSRSSRGSFSRRHNNKHARSSSRSRCRSLNRREHHRISHSRSRSRSRKSSVTNSDYRSPSRECITGVHRRRRSYSGNTSGDSPESKKSRGNSSLPYNKEPEKADQNGTNGTRSGEKRNDGPRFKEFSESHKRSNAILYQSQLVSDILGLSIMDKVGKPLKENNMKNTSQESNSMKYDKFEQMINVIKTLTIEDCVKFPADLDFETAYFLDVLVKLGDSKPKTIKALKNALTPSCKFVYVINPRSFQNFIKVPGTYSKRQSRSSIRRNGYVLVGNSKCTKEIKLNVKDIVHNTDEVLNINTYDAIGVKCPSTDTSKKVSREPFSKNLKKIPEPIKGNLVSMRYDKLYKILRKKVKFQTGRFGTTFCVSPLDFEATRKLESMVENLQQQMNSESKYLSNMAGLHDKLANLCVKNKTVDVDYLLSLLEKKGIVKIKSDCQVEYDLQYKSDEHGEDWKKLNRIESDNFFHQMRETSLNKYWSVLSM